MSRLHLPADAPPKPAVLVLLACVVASLALPHIPYVNYLWRPLMLLSTLVHELGHGIAGVLVGGDFHSFKMYFDGSGVARVSHSAGRIGSAIVSAGGLVGPAFAACGMFFLARSEKRARIALVAFAALLLFALVMVVRNLFGVAYVLAVVAVLFGVVKAGKPWLARFTLVFVAVQLALSVFSRGDYLFTDTANTATGAAPSDVANMAKALWLPYWFWGALCGAISLAVLALGLWLYLRPAKARP